MSTAAEFEGLARDFCAFVASTANLGPDALLRELEVRTARLYAAAVDLPDVRLPEQETNVDREDVTLLRKRLAKTFEKADYFRVVFDPWSDEDPVSSSLSDCVADICGDLREGLLILEAGGKREEAIWHWRLLFNSHWGRHAVEALAAMYALTRA
jgi:Domain of unknown function (DUF5063)